MPDELVDDGEVAGGVAVVVAVVVVLGVVELGADVM